MLRFLLRLVAVLHFNFTLYYDWVHIVPPKDTNASDAYPWFQPYKFKYLTFWDVVLQTIFFTICVLADLVAKDDQNHILRRLQNRIMVSLAYPLAMFVGVTFWAIYLVDRELILPKAMDAFFPVWLNHCMHTNIMAFMLIEFVMTNYKYPPRSKNLTILISVMLTYLVWLFVIYGATNVWVYPILHVLPWPLKIVFFLGCLVLAVGLYFSGEQLNKLLHKEDGSNARAVQAATTDDTARAPATDAQTTKGGRADKKEKKKKRSL